METRCRKGNEHAGKIEAETYPFGLEELMIRIYEQVKTLMSLGIHT